MWKKFRFFDFLEIFDELNIDSPWTLETDVLRKKFREYFKINVVFWVVITFWTFFIFQMALIVMLYHRVDFSEDTNRQIFLLAHSFFFMFFLCSAPLCFLRFVRPTENKDLISVFYTKVFRTIPYYMRKVRKKDIVDDCIDIETEVDFWL